VFRSRIYGPRCSFSRGSLALSRKQRHFLAFIASSAPPLKQKTPVGDPGRGFAVYVGFLCI